MLVLMALILSSAPFALVSDSSSASSSGVDTAQNGNASSKSHGNSGHGYDWADLADDDGYVDVIVVLSEDARSQNPSEHVIAKIAGKGGHDKLVDELEHSKKKQFTEAIDGFSARLSVASAEELSAADPSISVYPDSTVHAFVNYDIRQVGADQMWTQTDSNGQSVTGHGIVVAVIDTGIDYTHPDLGGGFGPSYKVIGGFDFVNNDSDPMDDNGHGTHVSGIIGANGGTFKGIAPDVKLLAYKALGSDGYGKSSDVLAAIDRAMDPNGDGSTSDHVAVISMSLGGPGDEDDPLCQAVDDAVDAGVVVVTAAGNDGPSMGTVGSPGSAPEAITVGAVDGTGKLADFSSRGTGSIDDIKPEVCAPGVLITSTVPLSASVPLGSNTGYRMLSGTSMAAPHVSGAAALILQLHPTWTPAEVKSAIVSASLDNPAPLWFSGAGDLWIPSAADADLLVSDPVPFCDLSTGGVSTLAISNLGASVTLSTSRADWNSLTYNGTVANAYWTNVSSVQPSPLTITASSTSTFTLSVAVPPASAPEGYYEGRVTFTSGGRELDLQFGFVILSRLNVHVIDMSGLEISDQYGWVSVYSVPDGAVAMRVTSDTGSCPPASFLLPSGTYSVHSAGHKMIYRYRDPYILSGQVTLARLQSQDLYLYMSAARQFTLDLSTSEGTSIYVKDYRVYVEDDGANNYSTELRGTDYTIAAEEMQVIPSSMTLYVSDTDAKVGISIVGYSYTSTMWEFMYRNRLYWHQFVGKSSTNFLIESTCDLQYFMAWEFPGVDGSTSRTLSLIPGQYSTYSTKYDIPGALRTYTGNWGNTLSPAGLTTLFVRKDSDAPINPFFAGMNRKTFVQGVFSEIYMPGDIYDESIERSFYSIDYSHSTLALPSAGIYLPDRSYIAPLPATTTSTRYGMGPFYPGLWTANTNSSMTLYQPLLKDQSGAKVIEMYFPTMKIYRGGSLLSSGDVQEFMARPDAFRVMSLTSGTYRLEFSAPASPQICTDAGIVLSFSVPGSDINPPKITGLEMSQKFIPGQSVPVVVSTTDDGSISSVDLSWRPSGDSSWQSLSVTNLGSGRYGASIATSVSDERINLKLRVTDTSNNYIEYTTCNASLRQIPVVFSLGASVQDIEYRSSDVVVTLTGCLTDVYGAPLSLGYAVPLELMLNGNKVGMILDEYVAPTGMSHNGTIRFDWHINPTKLFSGPDEVANIQVSFDLGIYQTASSTFTLRSSASSNQPPVITLHSPANNSLFAAGQIVDIDIVDAGSFTATASLDGVPVTPFASPWQISTSSWSDGWHTLSVLATDNDGGVSSASFSFEVDAISPTVSITIQPVNGTRIPVGSTLTASVSDARLSGVTCSIDGGAATTLSPPYSIDMSGWALGWHTVTITAVDSVNHQTSRSVTFQIVASSVILEVYSPANGSFVRSGSAISFAAVGNGTMTYRWSAGGIWHDIGSQTTISTSGWTQGMHTIIINATSDLGGWDQVVFVLTIDDVPPQIQLQSPSNESFVEPASVIRIQVQDFNVASVSWTLWGSTYSNTAADIVIPLSSSTCDGWFNITVTATDKAGNVGTAWFSFQMDSADPSLSISNMADGTAVTPGFVIRISAADSFLSTVLCSVDSEPQYQLSPPYMLDTSSLGPGWHTLNVTACDASGKSVSIEERFFIDDRAPGVTIDSGQTFSAGLDFEARANVTDEFSVAAVTLFYELQDGTFASVDMSVIGSDYVATIPSSALRDGMSMYVVASDSAGNSVETTHIVLRESSTSPGNDDLLPPGDGNKTAGAIFGFPVDILLILCGVVASSIAVVVYARRRRTDRDEKSEPTVSRASTAKAQRRLASTSKLTLPSSSGLVTSAKNLDISVPTARQSSVSHRPATAVAAPLVENTKPNLVDVIPTVNLRTPEQEEGSEPEVDYGKLIEQELIIPAMKNSIIRETLENMNDEIELKLEELKALCEEGRKRPPEPSWRS